ASLWVLLVGACAQPTRPSGPPDAEPTQPSAPSPSATPPIAVTVAASLYGTLQLRTNPGASCTLAVQIDAGQFGDGPPKTMNSVAGPDGLAAFVYPAPFIPAGHGRHRVS